MSSRPEPVLDAAKLAGAVSGAITGIGGVLVLVGYATTEDVTSWSVAAGGAVTGVGALISTVLPFITALGARAQVTPLADPVGVDGNVLVAELGLRRPAPQPEDLTAWMKSLRNELADEPPLPVEAQARAAVTRPGPSGAGSHRPRL